MTDLIQAAPIVRIPVRGGHAFPVRRIYCVGRNFADHAREMGAQAPASKAERGSPIFFHKPADALVIGGGAVAYPLATKDLHHEVELVVALGKDAPAGELSLDQAQALVLAYGIGLDLTRRDLQSAAKAKGGPWDTAKGFDQSAPISELVLASEVDGLQQRSVELQINSEVRQHGSLQDLIWDVAEILHELSKLYALKAGDLIFMGTPAGVGPLRVGDHFTATLQDVVALQGHIVAL